MGETYLCATADDFDPDWVDVWLWKEWGNTAYHLLAKVLPILLGVTLIVQIFLAVRAGNHAVQILGHFAVIFLR